MAIVRKQVTLDPNRRLSYYTEKVVPTVGEKNTNAALSWVQGESLHPFSTDITGHGHMCIES